MVFQKNKSILSVLQCAWHCYSLDDLWTRNAHVPNQKVILDINRIHSRFCALRCFITLSTVFLKFNKTNFLQFYNIVSFVWLPFIGEFQKFCLACGQWNKLANCWIQNVRFLVFKMVEALSQTDSIIGKYPLFSEWPTKYEENTV